MDEKWSCEVSKDEEFQMFPRLLHESLEGPEDIHDLRISPMSIGC